MTPPKTRTMKYTFALLLPLLLSSCGLSQRVGQGASSVADVVFYRNINTLHLMLASRSALNNNDGGEALPTVVWVYQLRDRKTFDTASYVALLKQDKTLLAADLLDKQVIQVMPASDAQLAVPMHAEAKFVAIVALFMKPDVPNNSWRVVIERNDLDPSKDRVVELNDNRLLLRKNQ